MGWLSRSGVQLCSLGSQCLHDGVRLGGQVLSGDGDGAAAGKVGVVDADDAHGARHGCGGELRDQRDAQAGCDHPQARRPAAHGVGDARVGERGPRLELWIGAVAALTDDPEFGGQFSGVDPFSVGKSVVSGDGQLELAGRDVASPMPE